MARKGQQSWNKGLTKETDARVRSYSQKLVNKPKSETHKNKLSKAIKGKKNPKLSETRKKLFKEGKLTSPKYWKGKIHNEEYKKNMANSCRNKILSLEHRKNISNALKRKFKSENHKQHLSNSQKGKIHTIEHNKNIGIASKQLWKNQEYREKQVKELKQRWQNPEYREKTLRAQRQSIHQKPNKKELFLDSLIQSNFPNVWKLNVNGNT
ncbi:MAG: NUMOD3 domain-containing DNA-binding protein, partial [Nanoarchaeota archaeon]